MRHNPSDFRLPNDSGSLNLIWRHDYPQEAAALLPAAAAPSLTQALSALNAAFSVRVLYLGTEPGQPENVFCRRVALCLNGIDVVHAHSVCLPDSVWQRELDCGDTPLGQRLFSGSLKLTRSPLQFSLPAGYLLARRSWFEQHGEKLYLSEYFLPALLRFTAAPHR